MNNSYCLVRGDKYRVCKVNKFKGNKVNYVPLNEGLAIEKLNSDNETYYVVLFLNWNSKNKEVNLEDIALRSIDILHDISQKELYEYVNCVDFAINFLYDINSKENN